MKKSIATPVRLLISAVLFSSTVWAQSPMIALNGSIQDVAKIPAATVTRQTLSQTEAGETLHFAVALRMRNFAELKAQLAQRKRVNRSEMEQTYHPLASDYQKVVNWLKTQGFTIGPEDPSHISVFASGTVAQISHAFSTHFSRVSFRGKERSSAVTPPSFPSDLSGLILGVNGLQPQFVKQKHSYRQRELPAGTFIKNSTTGNGPPFTPSQIIKAYGGNGLTQNGSGQTIAIVIDTPPLSTDLTKFWTTCNVPQSLSNITTVQVVSGTNPAPSGEESLDVEWSSSIAPAAKVRVYATTSLADSYLDQAYIQIYNDATTTQPTIHQVSLSYGLGELYSSNSQMTTDEQYFANLLSAGVTVFASSGDGGSNPDSNGNTNGATPNVENPANSPSVMGVGGTSLYVDSGSGAVTSETVWADSGNGATGGGISTYFTRPSWQFGNGVPSGNKRAVPDIASAGDPNTGCIVILNGTTYQYGGTSWSSPTWAGFAALINQARSANNLSALGSLGPRIYPLIGSTAFRDITTGNNGNYSANPGYDECSGVGVPNVAMLLTALVGGPIIDSSPSTQIASSGGNATYNISAQANNITYQWMRKPNGNSTFSNLTNNSTYSGCTSNSLTITNATNVMNGDSFQCVVTNPFGSATSASAQLIIVPPTLLLNVATLAGTQGVIGSSNGTGGQALFKNPSRAAVDGSGNIIITDTGNQTIRKMTPTGLVSTIGGVAGSPGSNNTLIGKFSSPTGIAIDSAGNIYIADTGNNVIRKILFSGGVTNLAGTAGSSGSRNGNGSIALFKAPKGVAVDSSGTVYVADTGNHTIRKITTSGYVSLFAGTAGLSGSADANGSNARFNSPSDVAVDGAGNVYVADTGNHTIRMITPNADVTTLAGSPSLIGTTDGFGSSARFNAPTGLSSDSNGNLVVADSGNHTIRTVAPSGYTTTPAGLAGSSGSQNGVGSMARFNNPGGVVTDANGTIYVVDTNNQTIRTATATISPQITSSNATTFTVGSLGSFAVTATGNPNPTFSATGLPSWAALDPTTGILSGTATVTTGAPFTIGITASNGTTPNATQTFTLNLKTIYSNWANSHFGTSSGDPSIAGPNADPDHDGIPNLLEYVLGSDPLVSSLASLPTSSLNIDSNDNQPHLTLTAHLAASASDVNISAEVSSDLQTWSSDPTAVKIIADNTTAGARTLTYEDTTPQNSANVRFIRLRAILP